MLDPLTPAEREIERLLRNTLGGTGAMDLRPSMRYTAKFCADKAAETRHGDGVAQCCHCQLKYAANSIERLIGLVEQMPTLIAQAREAERLRLALADLLGTLDTTYHGEDCPGDCLICEAVSEARAKMQPKEEKP